MQIINRKKQQGFTIIELIIVLAIAGFILTLVFIALPQLQRNQRDSQRQGMNARVSAELETFAANNQGTFPFANVSATWTNCATVNAIQKSCYDWYNRYINGKVDIKDPSSGNDVTINYSNLVANPTGTLVPGTTYIAVGAKCNGDSLTDADTTTVGSATSRQYATLTVTDRATTFHCTDAE